jgi:hypothetical protein
LTCYQGQWYGIEEYLVEFIKDVAPRFRDVAQELVFFADRIIRSCNNEVSIQNRNGVADLTEMVWLLALFIIELTHQLCLSLSVTCRTPLAGLRAALLVMRPTVAATAQTFVLAVAGCMVSCSARPAPISGWACVMRCALTLRTRLRGWWCNSK